MAGSFQVHAERAGLVLSLSGGPIPLPELGERVAATLVEVGMGLRECRRWQKEVSGVGDPGSVAAVRRPAQNVAAALTWCGREVTGWDGNEMALDEDPVVWSDLAQGRLQLFSLRARTTTGYLGTGVYEAYEGWGLDFLLPPKEPWAEVDGIFRPRLDLPLVTGTVERVSVLLDTDDILAEVHLTTTAGELLLMAAETDGPDVWVRGDESVVVLPEPARADTLDWRPPRIPWRF